MQRLKYHPELNQYDRHQYDRHLRLGCNEYYRPSAKELIYGLSTPDVYFDDKIHVIIKPEDESYFKDFKNRKKDDYLYSHPSMTIELVDETVKKMVNFFNLSVIINPQNYNLAWFYSEDRLFIINNYQRFIDGDCFRHINYIPLPENPPQSSVFPCSLIDKEDFRIVNFFSAAAILAQKCISFNINLPSRHFLVKEENFKRGQDEDFDSQFKLVKQEHLGKILSREINIWRQEMADTADDDLIDPELYAAYQDQIESILLKRD